MIDWSEDYEWVRSQWKEAQATADRRLVLLKRAKDMLEIGMPYVVELIEEIEKELEDEK